MFEDPSSHIRLELGKLPSDKVKLGNTYSFVSCPFHHERTPSLRIWHDPSRIRNGGWKCYGCSEHGNWNKLADALSLERFVTADDQELRNVPEFKYNALDTYFLEDLGEGSEIKQEDLEFFSLKDAKAVRQAGFKDNSWRGYDLEFLRRRIKAKIAKKYNKYWYLYLPVLVNDEEVGYIKAQVNKVKDIPSYINAGGHWSLSSGLFLFDQSIKLMRSMDKTSLVLVEGPRDALRLYSYGIPAVAILGTHSWSDRKSSLLEGAGVAKIISCFDGDDAGRTATRLICHGKTPDDRKISFSPLDTMFDLHVVRLWKCALPVGFKEKALDPGNMPESYLSKIHSFLA